MSKTTKIICDNCGRDLTWGGSMNTWRIGVYNERVHAGPPDENGCCAVVDVMTYPLLNHDMHFCGTGCLIKKIWEEHLYFSGLFTRHIEEKACE